MSAIGKVAIKEPLVDVVDSNQVVANNYLLKEVGFHRFISNFIVFGAGDTFYVRLVC